jgi:hypothetical protein
MKLTAHLHLGSEVKNVSSCSLSIAFLYVFVTWGFIARKDNFAFIHGCVTEFLNESDTSAKLWVQMSSSPSRLWPTTPLEGKFGRSSLSVVYQGLWPCHNSSC